MYNVTYTLRGSVRRKIYKTERGALKAIWRWLIQQQEQSSKLVVLYAPYEEPKFFEDHNQLPFEEKEDYIVDFYSSAKWKRLRYLAFERYGNQCSCCGTSPKNGAVLHVDHIKPRSTHQELELDISNLQILCSDCNIAKSNLSSRKWR